MTSLEECQPFKSLREICSWKQHVVCFKHTKPVPGLHQYIKWIIKYGCTITMTHLFNSIRMWRVHMRDFSGKVASYCRRSRKWQSTPVFLPGESHGQRSLGGYSPWGRKESDTTEQLHSLQKQVRHACSLDQLRDAHGKTDLHFTEASRRHSGRMGTAPAASDLHLVNGSAAQTEGRKGIRNSLLPWETSQRASVLGQAIPAPAGRFHTLCCWKTFYTLLPSVMSWLVYPSNSDVKVLQYFRTWPYVDTGSMQM